MWRESLIFERDGSWMRFGLPTKKKVRSRIFLVHRLDRARTTENRSSVPKVFVP